jgi:Tpt phosphate/phosphoenolpyruvate translocator
LVLGRTRTGRGISKRENPATWRVSAASSSPATDPKDSSGAGGNLVTAGYIALWYAVNVCFNLTNKTLYKSFPFPWTVSTVHVIVGAIYCLVCYGLGFKKASFGRPITGEELKKISGPASMHAFGHIAANLSFAAVAISLTHTVKTLEPAFSAVLQWGILGTATPLPVLGSLVPIIFGVGMVCASDLSFNWLGFSSAMFSNLTFGFRAVLSKKTMSDVKNLGSTALYAYTTVISVVLCAPLALIMEGKALPEGIKTAVATLGWAKFSTYLFAVGLFYHLYNQFAFNTLQRVNPVSHGVCNVIKRIIIIGSSVVFFGNVLTTKTIVGTCIALAGTALYTELQSRYKHKKQ